MFDTIIQFFQQPPPAMDQYFVLWFTALIGGNIILFTALWALLKYIAKLTPWAQDDEIIQILTGAYDAVKTAVGSVKRPPEPKVAVEEACLDHAVGQLDPAEIIEENTGGETCSHCGQSLEGLPPLG